jgi:hypothetical protein
MWRGFNGLLAGDLSYFGVWDIDGGYVFPQTNLPSRLAILIGKLLKSPKRAYHRRHLLSAIQTYTTGDKTFGDPGFDKETAQSLLSEFDEDQAQTIELSESDRKHLRDLGYLE